MLKILVELQDHFNGRTQLKRSAGTGDRARARRPQRNVSANPYAQFVACLTDPRDAIRDLLGWIGDAGEVLRSEGAGDLEGPI